MAAGLAWALAIAVPLQVYAAEPPVQRALLHQAGGANERAAAPDRRYVIGGLLVFAAQLGLIAGLLAQRARRRRAEDESKRAVAQNRDLAGRLLSSQEAERTRIARELHDGVCQELAGVAVDISYLRQRGAQLPQREAQDMLHSVQRRLGNMAETLRLLSHGLHPSVLQHVGLVAALQTHCAEVERQHRIKVTFAVDSRIEPLSPDASLELFRIAQEALANAARHARARRATVSLARRDRILVMRVSDDGAGFDVGAALERSGLGLVSIEERARLLHGRARIVSKPGAGTTVLVRVPLPLDEGPDLVSRYASTNSSSG